MMAGRLYDYVGPPEVAASVRGSPAGTPLKSEHDLKAWLAANREDLDSAGTITATFVIDQDGQLRVAQRRTEHIACASGGPVRSRSEERRVGKECRSRVGGAPETKNREIRA